MKILHTSDWHIGRTLYERKRYDEFEQFFSWLLKTIDSENIEVLLIAGDIFDTGTPSNRAQELYYKFLCDANKSSCKHIVIIGGNHDSASFLNAPQSILKSLNVHVIGATNHNLEDEIIVLDSKLIICAVPYLRDKDIRIVSAGESMEDKAQKLIHGIKEHYQRVSEIALQKREELYKDLATKNTSLNYIPIIAMGHLFAAGGLAGEGVRDLYVGSLAYVNIDCFPKSFDYVALGHLHIPQCLAGTQHGTLAERTSSRLRRTNDRSELGVHEDHEDDENAEIEVPQQSQHIRYSGSPIAMGFGEAAQLKKIISIDFPATENNKSNPEPFIQEISVPKFQALARISGDFKQIINEINILKNESSNAWLEIEYTGKEIIPDLKLKLDEAIQDSSLEIRRIKNKKIAESIMNNDFAEETLQDLNPKEVFMKCLDANNIMEEKERELLLVTHQEILNSILNENT